MAGPWGFALVTFCWWCFLRDSGSSRTFSMFTLSPSSPHIQKLHLHTPGTSSLPVFPLALPWKETVKHVPFTGTTSGTWGGGTFFLATTSLGASGTLKILIFWHLGVGQSHCKQKIHVDSRRHSLPCHTCRKIYLHLEEAQAFCEKSEVFSFQPWLLGKCPAL